MTPLLRRYRLVMGLFIVGLVLSGVTAFPLIPEIRLLARMLGIGDAVSTDGYTGLQAWILTVRLGLEDVQARNPWLFYGTDWLAFGHLVIAVFFIGPYREPVRNVWVVQAGLIACALVFPLALICGPLRGIPFYWRLIDCAFGVFGAVPLLYCLRLTPGLDKAVSAT